jgi:hypothetical protein
MAHEVGKVVEVTLYETSDGSVFETEELALNYEKLESEKLKLNDTQQKQKNSLYSLAQSYSKNVGYYRMINGKSWGDYSVLDGLNSMVLNTPETTLEMLTTIDKLGGEAPK